MLYHGVLAERPELPGRSDELTRIADELSRAHQGQCRVVLFVGEPGIGKTRLLAAAAALAAQEGALVRRGAASDAEGMPPYLPLREALGQHIQATPDALLLAQLGSFAPVLASILPELAPRIGAQIHLYPLPAEQARLRLYEAVAAVLAAIAAPQLLVLILDDLQWADRATLDLLSFIASHQSSARLLIIGAYRPGEAEENPALQRALNDLNRLRMLTTMTVEPLAAAALTALAGQYLGGPLDPHAGQMLYARSEGNPFFAEELLRAWMETGALTWSTDQWRYTAASRLRLPTSISGALRQRLARLSPKLLELLRVGALLGRSIDVTLLADLTGRDAEAIEEQLQVGVRLHILRITPDGRLAFSHDLIRACLADELTQARRRRLHGRIGQILEARGIFEDPQRLAELAFHFARSDDHSRGAAYGQRAGAAMAQIWASAEAADQYRTALSLLGPDDDRRGQLLYALGTLAISLNSPEEAISAFTAAQVWFLAQGDTVAAARAVEGAGRAWWQQEAIPQARAAFELSLTLLAERCVPERIDVLVSLSSLLSLSLLQRDAGLDYARRALALAQQLEEPRQIAMASRALGNGYVRAAQLAAGIALLEQARALALISDDPAEAAECCAGLRMACCWNAEYQRAIAYAHQEIAIAERCHAPYALRHVYTQLVVLTTVIDGAAAGQVMLTRAQALCHGLAAPDARAYLQLTEGMFWGLFQGDYERGEALARTAIASWRRLNPRVLVWYLGVFAMLLVKVGRRDEAADCLEELATLSAGMPAESVAAGQALSWVAAARLGLGQHTGLAQLAAQLQPFRGYLMTGGLIDRLLGAIAIVQGDHAAARHLLAAAETVARREGHRWELAQVLVAQADLAMVERESDNQVRDLLRAAQAQYRHVGNSVEVQLLEARQRRLDAPSTLPASLSPREAQVLRAVAAGQSNREIAEQLVLSRRTVENHLVNIYAKIGATNRATAVAFALRHGLA